ncbi:hypothetical protein B0H10DRAFT_2226770 [Mycena sp. CBHHK59/15]|nr:hypothetical protein B0H10DRAFT_2226770 [Mycena sp. CBHHK59/15]
MDADPYERIFLPTALLALVHAGVLLVVLLRNAYLAVTHTSARRFRSFSHTPSAPSMRTSPTHKPAAPVDRTLTFIQGPCAARSLPPQTQSSHKPFAADQQRCPPPPPRCASASIPASPLQSNAPPFDSTSRLPSQSAFHPSPSMRYPASADVRTPSLTAAADVPPVHLHRRTISYSHSHSSQTAFDAVCRAHDRTVSDSPSLHSHSHSPSCVRSQTNDKEKGSAQECEEREREKPAHPLPLALPKALRRTLARECGVGR